MQDGFEFDIPIGDVGPSLEKVIALIKSLSKELQSLNAIKPGAQLAAIDSMLPDDLPERTKQIKALVAAIKELHQTKSVSPQTKDKLSIEALSSLQQQLGGAMFLGSAPEESAKKAKKAAKDVVEAVGQIIREEKKLAQAPAMAPASAATPAVKDARTALKAWLDASNVVLKEGLASKSPLAMEGINLALKNLKDITNAALRKGFGDISREAIQISMEARAAMQGKAVSPAFEAEVATRRERWAGHKSPDNLSLQSHPAMPPIYEKFDNRVKPIASAVSESTAAAKAIGREIREAAKQAGLSLGETAASELRKGAMVAGSILAAGFGKNPADPRSRGPRNHPGKFSVLGAPPPFPENDEIQNWRDRWAQGLHEAERRRLQDPLKHHLGASGNNQPPLWETLGLGKPRKSGRLDNWMFDNEEAIRAGEKRSRRLEAAREVLYDRRDKVDTSTKEGEAEHKKYTDAIKRVSGAIRDQQKELHGIGAVHRGFNGMIRQGQYAISDFMAVLGSGGGFAQAFQGASNNIEMMLGTFSPWLAMLPAAATGIMLLKDAFTETEPVIDEFKEKIKSIRDQVDDIVVKQREEIAQKGGGLDKQQRVELAAIDQEANMGAQRKARQELLDREKEKEAELDKRQRGMLFLANNIRADLPARNLIRAALGQEKIDPGKPIKVPGKLDPVNQDDVDRAMELVNRFNKAENLKPGAANFLGGVQQIHKARRDLGDIRKERERLDKLAVEEDQAGLPDKAHFQSLKRAITPEVLEDILGKQSDVAKGVADPKIVEDMKAKLAPLLNREELVALDKSLALETKHTERELALIATKPEHEKKLIAEQLVEKSTKMKAKEQEDREALKPLELDLKRKQEVVLKDQIAEDKALKPAMVRRRQIELDEETKVNARERNLRIFQQQMQVQFPQIVRQGARLPALQEREKKRLEQDVVDARRNKAMRLAPIDEEIQKRRVNFEKQHGPDRQDEKEAKDKAAQEKIRIDAAMEAMKKALMDQVLEAMEKAAKKKEDKPAPVPARNANAFPQRAGAAA